METDAKEEEKKEQSSTTGLLDATVALPSRRKRRLQTMAIYI